MVGNDRSGTVDNNLNLLKAVELALTGGYDLLPVHRPDDRQGGTRSALTGADTGDRRNLHHLGAVLGGLRCPDAAHHPARAWRLYERSEAIRARYFQTTLPLLPGERLRRKGHGHQPGRRRAELRHHRRRSPMPPRSIRCWRSSTWCSIRRSARMPELVQALQDNWVGHEVLQAQALHKAPKYGRDDDEADEMAQAGDGPVDRGDLEAQDQLHRPPVPPGHAELELLDRRLPTSCRPARTGAPKGKFLSNAICPSNGADINGPTANVNSVGKVLGGKAADGKGDWEEYFNLLPNGGSHTITFNPSMLRDPEHRAEVQGLPARLRRKRRQRPADQHARRRHAARCPEAPRGLPPPAGARHRLQRLLHQPSARNCRTRSSPAKATRCDDR